VLYAEDNATPTSAAVGYVLTDGSETLRAESVPIEAFVSSAHLEFRALLEAVRAVDAHVPDPPSVHVHGDADVVIRTVDQSEPATPGDRLTRHRVEEIRDLVADVPVVTYRAVKRGRNERAHEVARAGHRT
jgi:ribonuclease HI